MQILVVAATALIAYMRYLHPTGKIMPGIYAIRTHRNGMPMGNLFILQAGDKYIAIDTGVDITETENGLKKLGIPADNVVAVFITHAHNDNIGSLSLFDSAVIYTGNTENSEFPDMPHKILPDGGSVKISDMTVQYLYTPGHTIDHVCYLVDGKYLFAAGYTSKLRGSCQY